MDAAHCPLANKLHEMLCTLSTSCRRLTDFRDFLTCSASMLLR